MGGKFLWDDDKETPEVLTSTYHYPEQKKMIQFEVRPWCTNEEDGVDVGNIFYGRRLHARAELRRVRGVPGREAGAGAEAERRGDHYANFVKAVRSRKTSDQNGPVETAHLASGLAHLGNISYRLERQLEFDPVNERFPHDEEANKMLTRKYRPPFVVPEKV